MLQRPVPLLHSAVEIDLSVITKDALAKFGYKFGKNGPHSSRTMMLSELEVLLSAVPIQAVQADYRRAIVEDNLLSKPSLKARELTYRHLADLYGLNPEQAVFRAFRKLWALDASSRPLLALMASLVRDPLLRSSEDFMLAKHPGEQVRREELEELLAADDPTRFSPASLKSFAQNINGSWTAAGYLQGRAKKIRSVPTVTHVHVAFALFLGHLEGLSGQTLFTSHWMALFPGATDKLELLATSAANRGLLVFMNAGGVKETRFPGWLTADEEQWRLEQSNV